MIKRLQLILICLLACMLGNKICIAGIEPYTNFIKGKVSKNDSLIVKDEKFRNSFYNWNDIQNSSVINTITLKIIDEQFISQSFSCEADIRILYFSTPGQLQPTEIKSVKLKVRYDKKQGSTYQVSDNYTFSKAHYVKIYVTNITSPEFGSNIPPILQLSSNIVIDRQYRFNPEASVNTKAVEVNQQPAKYSTESGGLSQMSASASSSSSYIKLVWPGLSGAEEFDLEWTTIDSGSNWQPLADSLLTIQEAVSINRLNALFRNNATRITTHEHEYNLSPVYNSDYLVARIRQVSYDNLGVRLEGPWYYDLDNDQDSYDIWQLEWHEQNLNWQYSASFAEEGKKKEVVSYFDGTLRQRQTATINNSDQIAVVQEKVYDTYGRAVADLLPAPVFEGSTIPTLRYFSNFNLDSIGRPYSFNDFKLLNCEIVPGRLSNDAGAAQYYSSLNPFASTINKFVPNAEGYPLSVTQYTADKTGRIKIQGGVGKTFQPGLLGESKTTKYYYAKPEQWELNRVFGNDVGYAEHYLKNMVADPNGQISISYLNASGKTIATALAGNVPESVDTLSSFPAKKLQKSQILKPEKFAFDVNEFSLKASTTYIASIGGQATLNYSVQKLISTYPGSSFQLCSNCYYQLTAKVSDDCNNVIYNTALPIGIGSNVSNCNDIGTATSIIQVNLPKPGEYFVSFELTMDKSVIEDYTTNYIQNSPAVKSEFSFIKPYLDSLDLSAGFSDCETCEKLLGERTSFKAVVTSRLSEVGVDLTNVNTNSDVQIWADTKYTTLQNACTTLKNSCLTSESPCARYEKLMLDDLIPGGQYALFDSVGSVVEPQANILGLYFKNGAFNTLQPSDQDYQDNLVTLEDGSTTSPYDENFTIQDLVKYWRDEWAVLFLNFHPELCKLQFCRDNSSYYSWDQQALSIESSADISKLQSGLAYNQSNAAWLLNADPFFKPGAPGTSYFSQMQEDLTNYSQRILLLNNPAGQVKGLTQFVDYSLYCSSLPRTGGSPDPWNTCAITESCRMKDKEWVLYRDTYLQIKENYYKLLRDAECTNQAECSIGTPQGIPAPGAIPTNHFAIQPNDEEEIICSSSQQRIKISYLNGKLTKNTTVEIYYPGITSQTTVLFEIGSASKYLCLPASLPLSSVKINTVR